MAVPTFTSMTPDQGHSGGTLVQIIGTNFRLIPEPPPGMPVTGPSTARVEVEFSKPGGGLVELATQVAVWDTDELYCVTPSLDPYEYSTVVTADAALNTLNAAAHGLANGTLVEFTTSGTAPGGIVSTTPYYVVNTAANSFQLSLTEGGAAIDITSAGTGVHIVKSDGAYDVTVRNLDDDDDPIPGETVTKTKVFRPLRPNLSQGGHLVDVIRAFQQELRRQVCENVSWTVHTEYNDESGAVEVAFPSRLPHLLLSDIEVNENRDRGVTFEEDDNYNDPDTQGDFVSYRRPMLVDVSGTLIGVSNETLELLTMVQATKVFFRKTHRLRVPRDPADSSVGKIEYPLRSSQNTAISPREDNTNLQYFTVDFRIVAVRLEDIAGMPAKTVPGVPTAGRPTEAIVGRGKTLQVDVVTLDGIDIGASPTEE